MEIVLCKLVSVIRVGEYIVSELLVSTVELFFSWG